MGLRNEFTEDRGPTLEGLEGERWKDVRVGDFIRGVLSSASVQDGTTLQGKPEKKMVVVLNAAVGMMDGVKVAAPVANLIANSGRGSALAEALDDAPLGCFVQVHFAATKPGATTGTRKLWVVKVWANDDMKVPPIAVVDMRTWGEKRAPAWSTPSEKVSAV